MMPEDEVFAVIKRHLMEVIPDLTPESISIDQTLTDLGCNSIDRVDVMTMTLEELNVTVPIIELGKVSNIRSLVVLLQEYL